MDKEIMELLQKLVKGQEETNARFDKIDVRFDKIDVRFDKIDVRLDKIETDVKELKEKIDNVYNQTANLTEFKTEVNTKLDVLNDNISNIEIVTANNWADIARLKKVK